MKKQILIPTISLFIICTVAAVLLAFTNVATADKIIQRAADMAKASQSKVLDTATAFADNTITVAGKEYIYQIGTAENGSVAGYVFTTSANGYGGPVKIMTGVDMDGTVHKIEILDVSKETPGLGLNATNESFYNQFTKKKAAIEVVKGNADGNQIKAITGATITSRAVTKAVNEALSVFEAVKSNEKLVGGVQ